jgi:prophage antirepressor-like protein
LKVYDQDVFFILDNDNQPLFKGKDLAEILGYEKSTNAISKDVGVDFNRKLIVVFFGNMLFLQKKKNINHKQFASIHGIY